MRPTFAAHTPPDGSDQWHDLKEHLQEVGAGTQNAANKFGAAILGQYTGLWHDLGKYNPDFQSYLEQCHAASQSNDDRKLKGSPHAIYGARLAWDLLKQTPLAPIIYGHHAGLPEMNHMKSQLVDPEFEERYQVVLQEAQQALGAFSPEVDACNTILRNIYNDAYDYKLDYELLTRLLFSCLVDADYLDTEEHFDPQQTAQRQQAATVAELWPKLEAAQTDLLATTGATATPVNQIRAEVYDACLSTAELTPGVFRLAVPTGGGKTRSGLAFALKHAVKWGCDRIIVAVPYTSIIEQTVKVYRGIFGDTAVLEHHSAANTDQFYENKKDETNDDARQQYAQARLATQNWDAPLIVTTTVQLFESLFANRPSKCRKLHNIVNSVIILDEVQTLPIGLLKPIVSLLQGLCDRYHVSVVLCTATQPALEGNTPYLEGFKDIRDIVSPDVARQHFKTLQRVNYEIQLQGWSWEQLTEDAISHQHQQALIVLNTRKDALSVLDTFATNTEFVAEDDIFHLSTLLCGKHRREVLAEVRTRLKEGQPCLLVSTQVVEAGVDIDFPAVYRALGPLDRIVQAAGRCNREGKSEQGRVVIFQPEEGKVPPGEYKAAVDETALLLRREELDLHDPSIFSEYFQHLYQQGTDKYEIQALRRSLNFPAVSKEFRLIKDETTSVVIRYDDQVSDQIRQIQRRGIFASDYRALQPYTVSLRDQEFRKAKDFCDEIAPGLFIWGGSYHPLKGIGIGGDAIAYDPADLII
ncbi:MAG: CRISPR-associated helicase Cas3' [Thermosynechococcaceae cyanobacterium]